MITIKRVLTVISICLLALVLTTGCGNKIKHVEGNLEDLMKQVYEGVPEEELPMGLENTKLDKDTQERFIGESKFEYKEGLGSESMMTSMAHSVVLIRMNEKVTAEEIEEAKKELKENINPRKWICVSVEEVKVESNGDLILVVLNDTFGDKMIENFKNIK